MTETPPDASPPPLPAAVKLVRIFSPSWLAWTIAFILIGLLLGVALPSNRIELVGQLSFGAVVGPAANTLSRVLLNRGLPGRAVNLAFAGFCAGLAAFAVLLVTGVIARAIGEGLPAVAMTLLFFPMAGYVATGAGVLIFGAKPAKARSASLAEIEGASPPEPTAAQIAEDVPSSPAPPLPEAASTPLGKIYAFIGNQHVAWCLAGAAAFGSITFFFNVDRGFMALVAAVVSFVALPASIMARSMLARRLPRAPVLASLGGLWIGCFYGAMGGSAALDEGPIGYLALFTFPIIGALLGFVLFGGIANFLVSKPPAAPPPREG